MASEFLRKKWGVYFEKNDLNGDGVVSMADANIFMDRFIKHHKIKGERAQRLKETFRAIWNSLLLFDLQEIDRQTFVDKMEKEYLEDKAKFIARHHQVQMDIVDIIDENNDGLISEDEYTVLVDSWGITCLDRQYVQLYPQIKPGYITKKTLSDSWAAFCTNDDVNNTVLERPVLIGFEMIDNN